MFTPDALIHEMPGLKKFAQRLTNNQDNAHDLLQATLLRAIEKKDQFTSGSNLFSWTSKIMYNLFVTSYRRAKRFETQYDPASYIEQQSVAPAQESQLAMKEVTDAMRQLSEDHREILLLVGVNGMAYADVAEILKVPVGTVRSRLSRAREALQGALEKVSRQYHRARNSMPEAYQIAQMAA